jgi:hypothetical protein
VTISLGFEKARAAQLYHAGLCYIRDVWKNGAFIFAASASVKFGLNMLRPGLSWRQPPSLPKPGQTFWEGFDPKKWVGIFDT